jgi:uncharacterized membrane protein YedE/YeeE
MLELQHWPWYVVGPIITAIMATLLFLGRRFGVSSNFETLCSIAGAGRVSDFFKIDWRARKWNLWFIGGTIGGGAIARYGLLGTDAPAHISKATIETYSAMGVADAGEVYNPSMLFGDQAWTSPAAMIFLLVGGFAIGFGTRWAKGCTSGHAISGMSSLQLPSLIAVVGFFIGGLTMTHLILPYLLPFIAG